MSENGIGDDKAIETIVNISGEYKITDEFRPKKSEKEIIWWKKIFKIKLIYIFKFIKHIKYFFIFIIKKIIHFFTYLFCINKNLLKIIII